MIPSLYSLYRHYLSNYLFIIFTTSYYNNQTTQTNYLFIIFTTSYYNNQTTQHWRYNNEW